MQHYLHHVGRTRNSCREWNGNFSRARDEVVGERKQRRVVDAEQRPQRGFSQIVFLLIHAHFKWRRPDCQGVQRTASWNEAWSSSIWRRQKHQRGRHGERGQQSLPTTVEQTFVQDVIKCHDKYIAFVSECFNDDVIFQQRSKTAFERFCNKSIGEVTIAELLANFLPLFLKKGGKEKLTDEVIEDHLEKIVKLLAYISDKDLFAEIAKQKLGQRLLQDQSASEDLERSLLSKLKQCNGAQFTMKMESMVSDLQMAKENNPKYVEWLREQSAKNNEAVPKTDMSVTILPDGTWPTYTRTEIKLPDELTQCVNKYEEFYENTHQSRS